VRGRIDVAKREFARTLPAHPLESQTDRLDVLEQVNRLQRENEQLKMELASLRGGAPTTVRTRVPLVDEPRATAERGTDTVQRPFITAYATPAPVPVEDSPVSLAPEDFEETNVNEPAIQPAPLGPGERTVPTRPNAPATSGRKHLVVKGDTLFSLAQRYYGNRSRWRDLYAANRDVLPSENSLRIGMELRIP
jgi:nucleoid-associated protein YgaU